MKKVLIIYGPRGGYTEKVADSIKSKLIDFDVTCLPGSMVTESVFNEYSSIIMGVATLGNDSWSFGRHDIDVNQIQVILHKYNFEAKKVALFGLGNAILYPAHFCDDMGAVEETLVKKKAEIIGYVSAKEYTFKDSKALRGDKFCGLALDDDTEHEKTESRIERWIDNIIPLL